MMHGRINIKLRYAYKSSARFMLPFLI